MDSSLMIRDGIKLAVITGRVSTDKQRDNYSIPTQYQLCRRLADEKGFQVAGDWWIDPVTGKDAAPGANAVPAYMDDFTGEDMLRPATNQLRAFVREHKVDAVIVLSIDRLARDPYIRMTLEREFATQGARVIYVQGGYTDTPEGEIHKQLDSMFANYENTKRKERSIRGKNAKAQSGKYVNGRAPYGYRADKDAPCGLVIVPDEAEVVRRIFHMYVEGEESTRQIAEILNHEGIPSARGQWGRSSIGHILQQSAYVGTSYWNQTRRAHVAGDGIATSKKYKQLPREEREHLEIQVTPLIDRVTWDRAQRVLERNKQARREQPARFYLLNGLIQCAACKYVYVGHTVTQPNGPEYVYYQHSRYNSQCRRHSIPGTLIDRRVWDGVLKKMLNPSEIDESYEAALAVHREVEVRAHAHLRTLHDTAEKLDRRRSKFQRMYGDDEMTKDEYQEEMAALRQEQAEVAARIKKSEAELTEMPSLDELKLLHDAAERIKAAVDAGMLTEDEKRQFLRLLDVRVLVDSSDKALVTGFFKPFDVALSHQSSV